MQSARVYIGHLPYKVRESDIEGFFSRYGRIREILLKNGFGFVVSDFFMQLKKKFLGFVLLGIR